MVSLLSDGTGCLNLMGSLKSLSLKVLKEPNAVSSGTTPKQWFIRNVEYGVDLVS